MTRLQSVTLKLPEVGKIQSTPPDVGSVVSVLADVCSSSQLRSDRLLYGLLLMALDVWKGAFVFLGRPDLATVHSTFCDPLLPTPSNYHIAPTEVAADTSIRPTWLLWEPYYTAPIEIRQLLVLPPVTS
ncbi:hypothetical protein TNCV_1645851 [Trichonephila clavipes]|nr:hypothetical protein TNCV_1645851 [Trichonephila clavipes]